MSRTPARPTPGSTRRERAITLVAASLAGAAVYSIAAYFSFVAQIPGTDGVYVRPGFAVLPFFGIAFGPVAGFLTGFLGNGVADELTGYGVTSAPLWHLANGLVGVAAALLVSRIRGTRLWRHNRVEFAALIGVAATAVGFLVIFAETVTQGLTVAAILGTEYVPAVVWNGLATAIGLPVLVLASERLVPRRLGPLRPTVAGASPSR